MKKDDRPSYLLLPFPSSRLSTMPAPTLKLVDIATAAAGLSAEDRQALERLLNKAGAPPPSPPCALGSPRPRNAPPTRVDGGNARPPPGRPTVGPRPGGWARGRGRSCARNEPPTSQGAVCELRVKNGPSSVQKGAEPGRRRPDRARNSPDHAAFKSNPPESGPNSGQKRVESVLKQAGKAGFV